MKELVIVENEDGWEDALKYASQRIKDGEVILLVQKDGVKRCIKCEPELFKLLHQFILDGGRACVCLESLEAFNIPATRPPDIFERLKNCETFIQELNQQGFTLRLF